MLKSEGKLIWKSDKKQNDELNKRIKSWKEGDGKDGFVVSAEGKFSYKGIKYLVKVLRYYNHTDRFVPMITRTSDSHAVVEYPNETVNIVDLMHQIEGHSSDFLYHDTLHFYNEKQSIQEQIDECHRLAKLDIDNIYGGFFLKEIDDKINELNMLKVKLRNLMQNKGGKQHGKA